MITCSVSAVTIETLSKTIPRLVDYLRIEPLKIFQSNRCCRDSSSSSSSSVKRTKFNTRIYASKNSNGNRKADDDRGEERKVHCEVEVVSWRERRIKAEISVNANIDFMWNALTDYERLADFIPNLVCSMRIPCPHPGRIWLEQRGLQSSLYWHIEARVVLDLQEILHSANDRELYFSMVDGDFKKFEGKWSIKSGTRYGTTTLTYELNVIPRFNFPAIFLERIIRSDLPVNLQALACRAEWSFQGKQKIPIIKNSFSGINLPVLTSPSLHCDGILHEKGEPPPGEFKENIASSKFGSFPPSSSDLNSKWGIFGKACRLDRPCVVDEVHLRRFDGLLENGGVHRGVVASITVKAPVREVWNVLTAYETLPEFVPNLAISKILSRENNKVRILQEGCKGLLYMVLHACVVLDICEHLEQEISFEQVEGDFDSFKGKWRLEQLGGNHTLLKYTVESKMHKNSLLSEAIMEEVIYEDLPSNLCAVRDYVEKRESDNSVRDDSPETRDRPQLSEDLELVASYSNDSESDYTSPNSFKQKPRVPGLQKDIEVLKAELQKFISQHGQEGFMPMRKQLRSHGRVDIEKAISHMGGFRRMASLMNLSLAYKHRKPKGYWDNFENLQEEISRFQRSWGMDPSFMPSRKSFERAGRYDIARALEKWGGLHEVSRLLSLKVRHPNRHSHIAKDKKVDYVESTDLEGEVKIPSKPYVSQDTQKWAMKLKDLDINWVE